MRAISEALLTAANIMHATCFQVMSKSSQQQERHMMLTKLKRNTHIVGCTCCKANLLNS